MTTELTTRCPKCLRIVSNRRMIHGHVRPRFLDRSKLSGTNKICIDCDMEAAVGQAYDFRSLAASLNKEPYVAFLSAMYEIDTLLLLKIPDARLSRAFLRILFASVVTSMETYLSDTFIPRVLNDAALVRRCVEKIPRLTEKRRRTQRQRSIFDEPTEVRDHLLRVTFHNLSTASTLYEDVLNIPFPPDTTDLILAVKMRHDIIHRSGKSTTGVEQLVSKADLLGLVVAVKQFVEHMEKQLVALA
jgi:hypothetical protein